MTKAAEKTTEPTIKTVEVDGIKVDVNLGFVQSWNGIRLAARMESSEHTDDERALATVSYMEHSIVNLDEVSSKIGSDRADTALALFQKAVQAAIPKA